MPEPTFETISNLQFLLLKAGAKKRFDMAYDGAVQAAEEYGGKAIGPEAWKAKDGTFVLLAFRGDTESEVALIQHDPAADPDPIPGYMAKYGDDILDTLNVSRVNWQKIVAGADWSEDAVVGSPPFFSTPDGFTSFLDPANYDIGASTEMSFADTPPCVKKEAGMTSGDGNAWGNLICNGGVWSGFRPRYFKADYLMITGTNPIYIDFTSVAGWNTGLISIQSGEIIEIPWSMLADSDFRSLDFTSGVGLIWDIQFSDEQYPGPY